ncbi:MAG TPA: site-specific integrase [Gammaproteobacteria bacterium]|nr:site-specific integrase [Gammaproteobacteria bacterium]
MFDKLFKRPYYIDRHFQAPFLKERLQYIQCCAEKGDVKSTLRDISQYLLRIIEFLNLEAHITINLVEIEQAADQWARHQSKHPQKRRSFSPKAKECFIWHATKWLKMINRLATLPEEKSPLLTKIFDRYAALKRHANAPLLKERLTYLQYWAENGAVETSLKRIAQYLLVVMEYLNFYELRMISKNEIAKAADKWAKNESIIKRKNNYSKFAKARFIRDAERWLETLGCLKKESKHPIPFEEYLNKYSDYMRHEQGLSENTIEGRFFQLKDFLVHVKNKKKSFAQITPIIVDDILTKKYSIDGYSRRTIQSYASVIRSFLRYTENQGWCQKNLADSIKAPRVYRYESLPYSPSWNDVKKNVRKYQDK